jgi:hypothetical protein
MQQKEQEEIVKVIPINYYSAVVVPLSKAKGASYQALIRFLLLQSIGWATGGWVLTSR